MKSRIVALSTFAILALGLAALAVQQQRADPQSTVEPRSTPGEGQAFLAKMAGDWKVTKKFYPRGGGEPSVVEGDCKQAMVQGGRFLQSDFTFKDTGGDTTGMGLIGYDTEQGVFTSFWIDSRSTRISLRQSKPKEKFDGQKIVLLSKSLAEEGPAARQSRTETHLENDGKTLVHQQFGLSADGPERKVMELLMTRK